jgi:hypothetical protein
MKSGGFDTRAAEPSAPQPAGPDRGFVITASVALGLAFVGACALTVAQFSILLTAATH